MDTQHRLPCTRYLLAGLFLAALTSLSNVQAQETTTPESATPEGPTRQSPTEQGPTGSLPADLADANLLPDADEDGLKPGEFLWLPAAQNATGAPLTIIVNLSAQRAYVYRDGQPIAVTTVSTGRPGRETPTGTFEILEKERMHHSNLYDDAPMPFMQRLTWTGLSLHAGHLPGHPASHGCVRLPPQFAEQLYQLTERGESVVISEDGTAEALARAGLETPIGLLADTRSAIHEVVDAVGPAPIQPSASAGSATGVADQDVSAAVSFSH